MFSNEKSDEKWLAEAYNLLISKIPAFQIMSPEVLPFGLRQHTRSICWLAEQVVIQNTIKFKDEVNADHIVEPTSDLTVWDFSMRRCDLNTTMFINVKVTDASKPRRRNDMSSLKKLLKFYEANPGCSLLYLVVPFRFQGNSIRFETPVRTGQYAKMQDFVLNTRNQHLQAYYDVGQVDRSNDEFCDLLLKTATQRGVKV